MFSKRMIQAASALSVGVLGMKNCFPPKISNKYIVDDNKRNTTLKLFDINKVSFLPACLSPILFATNYTYDPIRDQGFACSVSRAINQHSLGIHAHHLNWVIIEMPEYYAYFDPVNRREAFSVEGYSANLDGPDENRILSEHVLPPTCYPNGMNSKQARKIHEPECYAKKAQAFVDKSTQKLRGNNDHEVRNFLSCELQKRGGEALLISGPLFIYKAEKHLNYIGQAGKEDYDTTGNEIPTHYFYILVLRDAQGQSHLYSFITPNSDTAAPQRTGGRHVATQFLCPISVIDFFSQHQFAPNQPENFQSIHDNKDAVPAAEPPNEGANMSRFCPNQGRGRGRGRGHGENTLPCPGEGTLPGAGASIIRSGPNQGQGRGRGRGHGQPCEPMPFEGAAVGGCVPGEVRGQRQGAQGQGAQGGECRVIYSRRGHLNQATGQCIPNENQGACGGNEWSVNSNGEPGRWVNGRWKYPPGYEPTGEIGPFPSRRRRRNSE